MQIVRSPRSGRARYGNWGVKWMATGLLLLVFTSVFAQKEAKAGEWLEKSLAAFHQFESLSIGFTMNVRDVANQWTESFDGALDLKGAKLHMNTPDNEIWFDGKTQWVLQKDFVEVQISEPSEQEAQALNPAHVLNMYKNDCKYKYLGEKTGDKGRKVQEVELKPNGKGNEIVRIVMQIGVSDAMLSHIHIFYKNKIENVIHINKYQKNNALTDSSFVFDPKKYPDAEIIDLR
jgi:outer membrane lipoprotein-sorting protein